MHARRRVSGRRPLLGALAIVGVLAQPVIALVAAALSARQAAGDGREAPTGAPYDAIDRYLERQLDRLRVPGAAVAIVEGDRVVHERGFGRARPGGPPPSSQTPFFIGSLTKSFTALAVMQLVEAGKLSLDAPVQRYLPWFRVADPRASARLTVRHLLNQTSGLPQSTGWTPLADFDPSPGAGERQARALATLRLTRPIGSAFEYSNMNYILLGLIIEAVSGERYAAYVQRHIFGPLAMRHSYMSRAEAQSHGLALGHRYWFGYPVAAPDLPFPAGSLPAGQLISCTEDMSHYLIAQLNAGRYGDAQVLSPAGVAEMHRPAADAKVLGSYGMGWLVADRDQTRVVWHHGVVPDFFGYMAIVPGQRRGIVLLLNADGFLRQFALLEVGMGAAARLAGVPPDPMRLGFMPWAERALPAIPVLQVLGALQTLRRLRRWRRHPGTRPSGGRIWMLDVALPIIPSLLLAAIPIGLFASGLAGFLFVFAPDLSWLALLCGGFAGAWLVARTGLVLRALRAEAPKPRGGRPRWAFSAALPRPLPD